MFCTVWDEVFVCIRTRSPGAGIICSQGEFQGLYKYKKRISCPHILQTDESKSSHYFLQLLTMSCFVCPGCAALMHQRCENTWVGCKLDYSLTESEFPTIFYMLGGIHYSFLKKILEEILQELGLVQAAATERWP